MVLHYYQPYLLSYGVNVTYSGYVFAFAGIAAWITIYIFQRYDRIISHNPLLTISLIDIIGTLFCTILTISQHNHTILLTLSLLLSIEDIRSPIVKGFLSKASYGFRYKALLFSCYSVVESLGEILAGILLGGVVEYYGLKWGFIVSIVLFGISALCCMMVTSKEKMNYT